MRNHGRPAPTRAFARRALATVSALLVLGGTAVVGLRPPRAAAATPVRRQLHGVSCVSATFCMAVGEQAATRNGAVGTLTELWNGTKWSLVASPNPATSKFSRFYAVSCTSTTDCVAVGSQFNPTTSTSRALLARWDGTSWAIETNPVLPGDALYGVACKSPAFCMAVGLRSVGGTIGHTAYITRWNGQKWSSPALPNIANGRFSRLEGVSCTSTLRCVAAGSYLPPDGAALPLTERWNGTAWARVASTGTGELGEGDLLHSVSCASASNCIAAGEYELGGVGRPATFVEQWNGTSWQIVPSADPPRSYSALAGVSCHNATSCMAVGWYKRPPNATRTLTERWDGRRWSIVASPNPGGKVSKLDAVSCWAEAHCFAVGKHRDASIPRTLTERWNGTTWAVVPSP
jgi:hypothetical protein